MAGPQEADTTLQDISEAPAIAAEKPEPKKKRHTQGGRTANRSRRSRRILENLLPAQNGKSTPKRSALKSSPVSKARSAAACR